MDEILKCDLLLHKVAVVFLSLGNPKSRSSQSYSAVLSYGAVYCLNKHSLRFVRLNFSKTEIGENVYKFFLVS